MHCKDQNTFFNTNNAHNMAASTKGAELTTELKSEGVEITPQSADYQFPQGNESNEPQNEPSNEYSNENVNDTFTAAEKHQIEKEHEHFLLYNEKGNLQRISELSTAVLYQRHREIVFLPAEKLFYKYVPVTGLWESVTDIELEKDLTDFMKRFFTSMGMSCDDYSHKNGHSFMKKAIEVLKSRVCNERFFETPGVEVQYWLHLANGVLEFNPETSHWEFKPFSSKYRSRRRCELVYDPQAKPERFLGELVNPAMNEDDRRMFQEYFGQCIIGPNTSQTFLVITGTPGGGKSTLVSLARKIIGQRYCAELRLQHGYGRFEVSHYVGKTLLIGSDVPSDFLNRKELNRLKSYTGKDPLNYEYKCSSKFGEITGEFNIIITSNSSLQVRHDNDAGAISRRMRWIRFDNPPPKAPIQDFDELLFKEEGSGILNWALEGATRLIGNGGRITPSPEQKARVDLLLEETDPIKLFVQDYLVLDDEEDITLRELWNDFNSIREGRDFLSLKRASFNKALINEIDTRLHCMPRNDIRRVNGFQRGFKGVCFRPITVEQ